MNKYFYDMHIHSCLSPCADDDMTPNNIAGMATLKGLQILALTDHNSCKNCPAFFEACREQGIIAIAGMELSTAEDIHIVCLFESLENAMAFDKEIEAHLPDIKNRPEIFGTQYILDGDDEQIGEVEHLLINATEISIDEPLNVDWDGNELLLSDVLGSDGNEVGGRVESEDEKRLLNLQIDKLEEREKEIMSMRFGLSGNKEHTQKEVADILGISQSYISRLEKRIIARLKKELEKSLI